MAQHLLQWENFRRLYLFVMTENMRMILRRWQRQLFPSEEFKRDRGIVERDIWSAGTLLELDDCYTRKIHDFDTVEELYHWSSCINYLDSVTVPLVCINALDDPIIPPVVLEETIKAAASKHFFLLYENTEYYTEYYTEYRNDITSSQAHF